MFLSAVILGRQEHFRLNAADDLSEYFDHLAAGEPVDICYSIAENFYRSSIANIQLRIKDIREGKDTTL
ncbi:MAG: hypothetical protein IKX26_01045 [Bacteroidales bacterium]|nr:hypothetical protein [Bacteroidales bacterium]